MTPDNFRLAAVGGLADALGQIKLWQDGVRFTKAPALGVASPAPKLMTEDEAWDKLIREACNCGPWTSCYRCRYRDKING